MWAIQRAWSLDSKNKEVIEILYKINIYRESIELSFLFKIEEYWQLNWRYSIASYAVIFVFYRRWDTITCTWFYYFELPNFWSCHNIFLTVLFIAPRRWFVDSDNNDVSLDAFCQLNEVHSDIALVFLGTRLLLAGRRCTLWRPRHTLLIVFSAHNPFGQQDLKQQACFNFVFALGSCILTDEC